MLTPLQMDMYIAHEVVQGDCDCVQFTLSCSCSSASSSVSCIAAFAGQIVVQSYTLGRMEAYFKVHLMRYYAL